MNEELKVIISAEIDKLKNNVEKAKRSIKDFVKDGTKDLGELNEELQKAGDVSKKALGAFGVAAIGAATALLALGASTSEYRQAQAKLTTAFEAAGGSAADATETFNDLYRVLGDSDQATEAAAHLAKLTTGEKALSEWTNICQGVYATFGESIPIEGLTEAANETAKVGTVTGSLADALNWAGVNEDDFNEKLAACNSEAGRELLIRKTLNGIYSDAASKYEKNNAQILAQNEATRKMNDAMAELGEAVAPINTMLTELGAEILAELTPYLKDFADKYMPKIKDALSGLGETIGEVITWIADNWDLISTIATVLLGIAAAISVVSTVMSVVNAVMLASPVTWIVLGIVAAIAALVAIVAVIITYWDEIKAKTMEVWQAIMDFLSPVLTAIGDMFSAAWGVIEAVWNLAEPFFSAIWEAIKIIFSGVVDVLGGFFSAAWDAIKAVWDVVVSFFQTIWNSVKAIFSVVKDVLTGNFKGAWEGIKSIFSSFKKFFSDLWNGVKSIFSSVGSFFKNAFSSAWNGITSIFNKAKSFFKGIWDSITGIFKNIGSTIGNAIKSAVSKAVNAVLSTAVKIINGFISAINFAIGVINLIPGVEIGKISKLSVPEMEKGGVLKKGQVGLLEGNGTEAVVPLEKNTEWLDRIATMLGEKMGGGAPMVLEVDGKVFAQTAISTINQQTRQTGKLALNLM